MLSSRLILVTVLEEIEKIMRRFFWGTTEGRKNYHLVAFEGLCWPFDLGGLGLKRLREINISLLCKWFWRLREDCLWVQLIKEKYGFEVGNFFPKKSRLPYGVSVWRGLSKVEDFFKKLTKFCRR